MAVDTIQGIVVARMPSASGDSRLDDYEELAKMRVGACAFGDRYNYAVACIVLHMLALDARAGGENVTGIGGEVKSEKEGQLARSYGSTGLSMAESDLATTSYGQEFLGLKKENVIPFRNRTIGCGD